MELLKNILNWLWPNAPWIIPTLSIAVLSWKLSRWTKSISETKDKVDKLPCESHKATIASNKSDLDRHFATSDTLIAEHTRRLSAVETKLERWDDKMMDLALSGTSSAKKRSPYTLTPFGEFILQKSLGKDCIDRNIELYFAQLDEQPHTTPFDIERSALGVVIDSFRTDTTNSVKNFIYTSPANIEFNGKDHELSITDIQVAMAIYLRDLYLKRNESRGQLTGVSESQNSLNSSTHPQASAANNVPGENQSDEATE